MAEPLSKRSRRDNDYDRPRFDPRNPRDQRGGARPDTDRSGGDRSRTYRSRSPERPHIRDRERSDRGGGRRDDGRDRDTGRSDGLRDDDRHRSRPDYRSTDRDRDRYGGGRGGKDYEYGQRDRKRVREEEEVKARSRSPRRDRFHDRDAAAQSSRPDFERVAEQDIPLRAASRTSTPPVAFNLGRPDSRGASKDRDIRSPSHPHEDSISTTAKRKSKPKASDFIGGDNMDVEGGEEEDIVVEDDGLAAMQAMMGFGGFGTTKQKKIPGNNIGAVRKEKKSEYRQYMNRQGGFNRPLSPSRD